MELNSLEIQWLFGLLFEFIVVHLGFLQETI